MSENKQSKTDKNSPETKKTSKSVNKSSDSKKEGSTKEDDKTRESEIEEEELEMAEDAKNEVDDEDIAENNEDKEADPEETKDKAKDKKQGKLARFFQNPKKRLIFIIIVGLILIATFGVGLYYLTFRDQPIKQQTTTKTTSPNKQEEQKPVLSPAVLDGVMTDNDSATKHPLAVVVENHVDARPQSGLSRASVVYEALAEGGITRYLAIFGTNEAEKVGPIRSARTYFVDWAHGYDAFLAHVGGNIDALDKIASDKIFDLDQFKYSSPYWRERQTGLATEHTMYSSTTALRKQADSNKYPTANNFSVLKFKDDPTDKTALPESQTISINYSNPSYAVKFVYDKETDSYKRYLAGVKDVDNLTKTQLNPKNVVIMTVSAKATLTRINEQGLTMTTIGTGKALIFQDGKEITGTWKKDSASDREIFYDGSGQEITFNRGQLWISVIPPDVKPVVQ